jgi:spore coat protein U-like protein
MQLSKTLKPVLTAAVLGCLALGTAPTSANAATVSAPIAVSATVQATCIVSAGAMAFGTYTGVVSNTTATVSVTCTNTTPYNVGLDAGLTGTVTARVMKFGAVALCAVQ